MQAYRFVTLVVIQLIIINLNKFRLKIFAEMIFLLPSQFCDTNFMTVKNSQITGDKCNWRRITWRNQTATINCRSFHSFCWQSSADNPGDFFLYVQKGLTGTRTRPAQLPPLPNSTMNYEPPPPTRSDYSSFVHFYLCLLHLIPLGELTIASYKEACYCYIGITVCHSTSN